MSLLSRVGRFALWMFVLCMVLLAVGITALRFFLPTINTYKPQIETKISELTGINIQFNSIEGHWHNLYPSLKLQGITIVLPDLENTEPEHIETGNSEPENIELENIELENSELENSELPSAQSNITIASADIRLDTFQSLLNWKPVLNSIDVEALNGDVSRWDILSDLSYEPETQSVDVSTAQSSENNSTQPFLNFMFNDIKRLNVFDSHIGYKAVNDEHRMLDLDTFYWLNDGKSHKALAVISVEGTSINQVTVIADFDDKDTFEAIDGKFLVSAQDINVLPWMSKWLQQETSIQSGNVSVSAWIDIKNGRPQEAILQLFPSQLTWGTEEAPQTLAINEGVLKITPKESGWLLYSEKLDLMTNEMPWSDFSLLLDWNDDYKLLNVSQLELSHLLPLLHLVPNQPELQEAITQLNPQGKVSGIRVYQPEDIKGITYSAQFDHGSVKAWNSLPEINNLSASLAGDYDKASLNLSLKNEVLPYPLVLSAPLNINNLDAELTFARGPNSWSIQAKEIALNTPDINALASFKLNFPEQASPILSLYAEASLDDAKKFEYYLPRNALGKEAADYLSGAIQGGKADANVVWYGALDAFPYDKNEGIFQAKVTIDDGVFQFNPDWPTVNKFDLNLLFENYALYLNAPSLELMKVKATNVSGVIPALTADGKLTISAKGVGDGEDVRDYVMQTPLADSVGEALTAIGIKGQIKADVQLSIPLDGVNVRAKGKVTLAGNPIDIKTPEISLTRAQGVIHFDDENIKANKLSANWFGQPVAIQVTGQSQKSDYRININASGKDGLAILNKGYNSVWWDNLKGAAPWKMDAALQVTKSNTKYQVNSQVDMKKLSSNLPAPLAKKSGAAKVLKVDVMGDQNYLTLNAVLPEVKYQANMSFVTKHSGFTDSRIVVGKVKNLPKAYQGHSLVMNQAKFNADPWIDLFLKANDSKAKTTSTAQNKNSSSNDTYFQLPEKVDITSNNLKLNDMDWHNVKFTATKQINDWNMQIQSRELEGNGTLKNYTDLVLNMKTVHLFLPNWDVEKDDVLLGDSDDDRPSITQFDRDFHANMINLDLNISDFWLQGYKIGNTSMVMKRNGDKWLWENLELKTGTNHLKGSGWWRLNGERSHSNFNFTLDGENNSDVMARFGIHSGVQDANFKMSLSSTWEGAPWGMQMESLNGQLSSEFTDGKITDVNGAARILGLFSLDSIISKMKLDFTGVFDSGMTFSSIKGTGTIVRGVFTTNDFEMDGSAGDLELTGSADLSKRTVDANVVFYPDLTTSLPLVAAFAVTPQTGLAVLALTTIFNPIIDVFTKVEYSVKGPIESPEVTEVSRSKGKVDTSKTP